MSRSPNSFQSKREKENGWMNFGQEKKKLKRDLGPG